VSGIHHFVPVLHRGDAVGRHTLRLRDATRARGLSSNIFVDVVQDETAEDTAPVLTYRAMAEPGDVVVYQFATASMMAPWLAGRSETLVVNYHNVTPPELMEPWDHHLALGQARAQSDLEVLAARSTLAVADSGYNETHLAEAGFVATAVIAPSAALRADGSTPRAAGATNATADADATDAQRTKGSARSTTWLSIGRVSPNKSLEHAITALAVTRLRRDPTATLRIIGKPATHSYDQALRRFVAELGLLDAVSFEGHASDATVAEAYATSDLLVVTSEHEGFCVPVVEAMAAGLPVVAFDQGAIPEVLGDAGILITTRDPYVVADAIADLLADGTRRADLAHKARRRIEELRLDTTAERFVDLLVPLLEPGRPAHHQQDLHNHNRKSRR
jgi:glycosyltransferase involved in cell wall biosynthesis